MIDQRLVSMKDMGTSPFVFDIGNARVFQADRTKEHGRKYDP
jgi:hypothetical protein